MDWNGYSKTARHAAAESAVLLRNESNALPILAGEKVAVFGRIQFNYYRSGTGSGGMVNVPYETNILDALKESELCRIDQTVENIYRKWLIEHPFDKTFIEKDFWYIEPWAQEEMPVTESMVAEAAGRNQSAIIIIGRTAGEERDSLPEKGSWYLSEIEEDLIAFSKNNRCIKYCKYYRHELGRNISAFIGTICMARGHGRRKCSSRYFTWTCKSLW